MSSKSRVVPEMNIQANDSTSQEERADPSLFRWRDLWEHGFSWHIIKVSIVHFLDNATLNIHVSFDDVMMGLTIFVLFSEDIRKYFFSEDADHAFEVITTVCLFLFIFEMMLNITAKTTMIPKEGQKVPAFDGYLFSFFFWCDFISILSLLPDIPWIAEGLGIGFLVNDSSEVTSTSQAGIEKAGRVIRMVRLVRLVRLYKIASNRKKEREIAEELDVLVEQGVISDEERFQKGQLHATRQSKVGAELSDTITQRVIFIILLMLSFVPFLTFSEGNQIEPYSAKLLHELNLQGDPAVIDEYLSAMNDWVGAHADGSPYLAYALASPSSYEGSLPMVSKPSLLRSLRSNEYVTYEHSTFVNGTTYETIVKYNQLYFVQDIALRSILLTLFVSIMLLIGAMRITADAHQLVLAPIERMMNMVDILAMDPLQELHFDSSKKTDKKNKKDQKGKKGQRYRQQDRFEEEEEEEDEAMDGEYETKLLENTLEKLTGLLRVGFGEAGANIISDNLNLTDTSSNTLIDPMIAGKRIYAIFGFCDIHHFQEITTTLQGEVMVFVNTVAEVVHGTVERFSGQSNKNLGNAFLMVWRIGDKEFVESVNDISIGGRKSMSSSFASSSSLLSSPLKSPSRSSSKAFSFNNSSSSSSYSVDLRRIPGVDRLADQALIAFLKVIVRINSEPSILAYRDNERLKDTFGGDYKLRMGFGLHAGWAIEGAVGSLHKVDATYLSPHVNMCARMESASRQYGVPLLMTEDFVQLLSPEGLKACRKLDVVTVKGSEVPMGVYTYDTYQERDFSFDRETFQPRSAYSPDMWKTDRELLGLKAHVSDEFVISFNEGVKQYILGNWLKAKELLEYCHDMMHDTGGDGPSCTLLRYMAARYFEAPEGWEGYRPLTSK